MPGELTAGPGLDVQRIFYCGVADEAAPGIADQIDVTLELGWRAVELRTVDGLGVDQLSGPEFARAAARIAEAGLAVPVVASRIGGWSRPVDCDFAAELAELAVLAERCAVLGTRFVRIMSYPNDGRPDDGWEREVVRRIGALADRAADAGLVLLHENCSGWAGRDATRALRLVAAVREDAFGLLFDTGNGAAHGYRSYPMLRELAGHVRHVHVKDAVGGPAAPEYRLPGEGEAQVTEVLRLLAEGGYRGGWSIEPHLAVRPHEGHRDGPAECRAAFLASGRALRALAERVASGSGWRSGPAGLERVPC
ncbi:sugar phosphate isomerase/epimerase family protein [Kitasatospora sp. NPDC052896]|uniref:sugar phosphate isomerase/epimerase family protein n=1 Tax=Kitasatospora sp. NPDC052896 TaxID=3364061 RepID=UPI0037C4FBB7